MADEQVRIEVPGHGHMTGFVSAPPAGHGPGLLVLPEIFNSNAHVRQVAERFSAAGFVTLAPDVYWRQQPDMYFPYTEAGREQARACNERLDVHTLIEDLGHCVAYLRGRLNREDARIGAVGFCLGGKLAYLCASRLPVDVAVSYYGVRIEAHLDEADAITCPLVLHFAGNDSRVPPEAVAAIGARMGEMANVALYQYPGAEHAFNRRGYPSYHPQAAELAWGRTLDALAAALGA